MGYHSVAELGQLGGQIRDKAIDVCFRREIVETMNRIREVAEEEGVPPVDEGGPVLDEARIKWRLHQFYDYIPDLFTQFDYPDPAKMQGSIGSPWSVAYALVPETLGHFANTPLKDPIPANAWHLKDSVSSRIGQIEGNLLSYWEGVAADGFKNEYLDRLKSTVGPQAGLAAVLAVALAAHQRIRQTTFDNIWDVGQQTLAALNGLYSSNPGSGKVVLSVLTSAISVLMAIPTDGLSFAGLYGLGMAGVGLADAVAASTKLISGGTVQSVINSMSDRIADILTGIEQQEQEICDFLDKISTQLRPEDLTVPSPKPVTDLAGADVNTLRANFSGRPTS